MSSQAQKWNLEHLFFQTVSQNNKLSYTMRNYWEGFLNYIKDKAENYVLSALHINFSESLVSDLAKIKWNFISGICGHLHVHPCGVHLPVIFSACNCAHITRVIASTTRAIASTTRAIARSRTQTGIKHTYANWNVNRRAVARIGIKIITDLKPWMYLESIWCVQLQVHLPVSWKFLQARRCSIVKNLQNEN